MHRDIKPANIVFDERRRRFRLIDLGAAACLRTGTNYKPSETILDPCYCPPEEVSRPRPHPPCPWAPTHSHTKLPLSSVSRQGGQGGKRERMSRQGAGAG